MRRPLPFFARAGYAWGASTFVQPPGEQGKGKSKGKKTATAATKDPRDEATKAYHEQPADYSSGGDAQDAYVALCFRGIDPMVERWDDFERLAERLFDGWRQAMLEGEG